MSEQYLLDVTLTADLAGMGFPRFVGPFTTRRLAERWGVGFLDEHSWNVVPVVDQDTLEWMLRKPDSALGITQEATEPLAERLSRFGSSGHVKVDRRLENGDV